LDGIITFFGGSGKSLIYALECAYATCKDGNLFPFVVIVASKVDVVVRRMKLWKSTPSKQGCTMRITHN